MTGDILDEVYLRLRETGPEWGENQLTNHGPMAAEVLVRRGHTKAVDAWVDSYLNRLDDLPSTTARITADTWPEAMGDGRRIGDWTAYFEDQLASAPWRSVLATWWPRLLPGIMAGATHGLIRTGHVVRTLLAGDESAPARAELARGLAFWAARSRAVPGVVAPAGDLDASAALAGVPRIPDQSGNLAHRFGQFTSMDAWPQALSALRAPVEPQDVLDRLADLVHAATVHYLHHGHASPILLVHAATAPNAMRHTLPALPEDLWAPSLTAVWGAAAAVVSAFAPVHPTAVEINAGTVDDVLERAVAHGDEHVIKFSDTAAEAYELTADPRTLQAAVRSTAIIGH
ncbi:questin oxidase family protein [Kibdelosporangium lantanae]